jgi:succinate dehydrogenase / fumarate reductase, cytochrome b subunit
MLFMKKRPVFLNVFQIQMPVTALVSILHRASGVLLFLLLPFVLFLFQKSLSSEAGFQAASSWLDSGFMAVFLWLMLSALMYHLIAGLRHLMMDMGLLSARLTVGRLSAWTVLLLAVGMSFWMGCRLW